MPFNHKIELYFTGNNMRKKLAAKKAFLSLEKILRFFLQKPKKVQSFYKNSPTKLKKNT